MSGMNIEALVEKIKAAPDFEAGSPCFLSVYEVGECYGGPEEGGWWYSAHGYEGSIPCASRAEAELLRERLEAEVNAEREPFRPAYAALGEEPSSSYPEGYIPSGWCAESKYRVLIEDRRGEHESHGRPHYE